MYIFIDYFLDIILINIDILTGRSDTKILKEKLKTYIIKIIEKKETDKKTIFNILYKYLYNEKLLSYKKNDYIKLYTKIQMYIEKLNSNHDMLNKIEIDILKYNNIIYYFIDTYNIYILLNTVMKPCFANTISLILYNNILKFINNIMSIHNYININSNVNILDNISNIIILRYKLINLLQYNIIPNLIKFYYNKDKTIIYIYKNLSLKNRWDLLDKNDISNLDFLKYLGGAKIDLNEKDKILFVIEKIKQLQSSNEIYKNDKTFDDFIVFLSNPYIQKSILIDNIQLPTAYKNILNILESQKNDSSNNVSLNIFNELLNTDIGNKLCKIYKQENLATDDVKKVIFDLNNNPETEKYSTNFEFTKNDVIFLTILSCLDAIKKEANNSNVSVNDESKNNSTIVQLNYPVSKFKINDKLFTLK